MTRRNKDLSGRAYPVLCLLLVAACTAGACGCTALMTPRGPLLRFLDAGIPEPGPAGTAPPPGAAVPVGTATPAATIAANGTGGLFENATRESVPAPAAYAPLAVAVLPGDGISYRTFTFSYRSKEYTVTLPVNMSLYRAANASANRDAVFDDSGIATYYRQLAADTALDPFFTAAEQQLDLLRYGGGKLMSDDEYLELIVSFVQQIPSVPVDRTPRFPVEVVGDEEGTFNEKAVLLTGLLARGGYDTALMVFPGDGHAAAGLRLHLKTANPVFPVFSNDSRDYLYATASETRLIGLCPEEYEGAPPPVIIPAGTGSLLYGKTREVAMVFYDLRTIRTNRDALQDKRDAPGPGLADWEREALESYTDTYALVRSTNDMAAALEAIRESALPHYSSCMSCR